MRCSAVPSASVLLDGYLIGGNGSEAYIFGQIFPGRHTLVPKTENGE